MIGIVYADLGLDPDPAAMAESADWLHDYTGELFEAGLPWCAGARELLERWSPHGYRWHWSPTPAGRSPRRR